MNIDRDDEYATRYEAAPTIAEQIEYMKRYCGQYKEGYEILASLEKLAALESQPVPVEPVCVKAMRMFANNGNTDAKEGVEYIDSLQSALKRAQEEIKSERECRNAAARAYEKAEAELKWVQEERDAKFEQLQISEAHLKLAEAELKRAQEEHKKEVKELFNIGIHHQKRAEKAESLNRRMVELLKEPSEGMMMAAMKVPFTEENGGREFSPCAIFKAMSAELLKEVGE